MTRIGELVGRFASSVAAQTDAIRMGDSTAGNRHADACLSAFEALRGYGDEGRDTLATLMGSEQRADVRTMAAAFLLRHRHAEARQVLEEIGQGVGFAPFCARQALKRWEDGTWTLDPAPSERGPHEDP